MYCTKTENRGCLSMNIAFIHVHFGFYNHLIAPALCHQCLLVHFSIHVIPTISNSNNPYNLQI